MKRTIIILVVGFLLLGSNAGAQFATPLDSSDVAGWKFTTFTDVDDSLKAGYQIYQKIDSTDAVIDSAVGAERADTTIAEFLHKEGGTMTGNITIADDGWIGGGAAKGRIIFKDETQDTLTMWDCHIRVQYIHAITVNTLAAVYCGNDFTVAGGTVTMTAATVNLPTGAVDASAEISTQIILPSHVDSTSRNFIFDGAYHKTSEEADSAYLTHGGAAATYLTGDATTSANWATRVSDETGTGLWVFGTSPTFTTDITSPLVIGGTATTSDLSLKTTSGVGETGADMHFLVGNNGATEAMTVLNSGNVGVGINSPSSILHVKASVPGVIGSHSAGQLIIQNPTNSVYANAVITGYESDAGGNPDQQLWYLGGSSGSSSDVTLLNRRNSKLHLGANGATKMTILGDGNVGIGTLNPPERLSVVGNIATGDSTTGDVDVFHYFSTDASWTTEYLKWDDGDARFELSDDLYVGGTVTSLDTLTRGFSIQSPDEGHDLPLWMTPKAITLIAASGVAVGGTNVVGVLMEYDNDAANPAVCNSSDWTFTTGEERTTSLSNASIDAGDWLGWKTTSVSGEVDFISITFEYTQP